MKEINGANLSRDRKARDRDIYSKNTQTLYHCDLLKIFTCLFVYGTFMPPISPTK